MFLQNGKFGQLGEIETSRCKCVSTVGNEEEEARQGKAGSGKGAAGGNTGCQVTQGTVCALDGGTLSTHRMGPLGPVTCPLGEEGLTFFFFFFRFVSSAVFPNLGEHPARGSV